MKEKGSKGLVTRSSSKDHGPPHQCVLTQSARPETAVRMVVILTRQALGWVVQGQQPLLQLWEATLRELQ